jgi:hypothetical protein
MQTGEAFAVIQLLGFRLVVDEVARPPLAELERGDLLTRTWGENLSHGLGPDNVSRLLNGQVETLTSGCIAQLGLTRTPRGLPDGPEVCHRVVRRCSVFVSLLYPDY